MTKPLSAEDIEFLTMQGIPGYQRDMIVKKISEALTLAQAQGREEGSEDQAVKIANATISEACKEAYAKGFAEGVAADRDSMIREYGNDYIQTGETVKELVEVLPALAPEVKGCPEGLVDCKIVGSHVHEIGGPSEVKP